MTPERWAVVVVAGVVTYLVRASFLVVAERMVELPERVQVVLRMIPAAAMAAIVLPALLRPDGAGYEPLTPLMVAAVVTAVVARWRHDVGLALGAGLLVVLVLEQVPL